MPHDTIACQNYELMQTTAEMLAMPFLACRRRLCRRGLRCLYLAAEKLEPWCLSAFDPAARILYDRFYGTALAMLEGRYASRPSAYPDQLEIEVAAMQIIEATFSDTVERMQRYRRWKADFFRPPSPPFDPGLAQRMRAEFEKITAGDPR